MLSSRLDGSATQPSLDLDLFLPLLDPHVLTQLASWSFNQRTGGLPAMLLLLLLRVAWGSDHGRAVVHKGGLMVLHSLLTQLKRAEGESEREVLSEQAVAVDADTTKAITVESRALLLDALACSEHAREMLLTAYTSLSSHMSLLTEAMRDDIETKGRREVELRPREGGMACRVSSELLHARCPGVSSGRCVGTHDL